MKLKVFSKEKALRYMEWALQNAEPEHRKNVLKHYKRNYVGTPRIIILQGK